MQLDLTRIRKAEEHVERTIQPSEVVLEDEAYRVASPVELTFDVHKDKDRFRLTGRVRGLLELTCSRCLEPFPWPVDMAFDHRYLPQSESATDAETEIEEYDLETSYYQDDRIDLDDLVREQFYLALPMKPLCGDACKGLCPQCGTNWNVSGCECRAGWEDPRLAGLKKLM